MKSKCKLLILVAILFVALSQTSSVVEKTQEPILISGMHFPPPFANHRHEIQINSIPPPLDINGKLPFTVWVNGKQLHLNGKKLQGLKKYLGLKQENPNSIADIHSGKGWLRPRILKQ